MTALKKNKTIIIGKSGSGKSFMALNMALTQKRKGTSIICNGCANKDYYDDHFPRLKSYESKDGKYNFVVKKDKKYYIYAENTESCKSATRFVNALIYGCDYGKLGNDKNATIIYDDNSWVCSENNLITLWKLSHENCRIIITADSICDILKISEYELTEEMIKDISKYWNIINLAKAEYCGHAVLQKNKESERKC